MPGYINNFFQGIQAAQQEQSQDLLLEQAAMELSLQREAFPIRKQALLSQYQAQHLNNRLAIESFPLVREANQANHELGMLQIEQQRDLLPIQTETEKTRLQLNQVQFADQLATARFEAEVNKSELLARDRARKELQTIANMPSGPASVFQEETKARISELESQIKAKDTAAKYRDEPFGSEYQKQSFTSDPERERLQGEVDSLRRGKDGELSLRYSELINWAKNPLNAKMVASNPSLQQAFEAMLLAERANPANDVHYRGEMVANLEKQLTDKISSLPATRQAFFAEEYAPLLSRLKKREDVPPDAVYQALVDMNSTDIKGVDDILSVRQKRQIDVSAENREIAEANAKLAGGGDFNFAEMKEAQAKAYTAAARMAKSAAVLDELETDPDFKPEGVIDTLQRKGYIPELFKSENAKRYAAALMEFTDAQLRFTSGAAVPEQEVQRAVGRYGVSIGDTEAVVEQKRSDRQINVQSARDISGVPEDAFNQRVGLSGGQQAIPEASSLDEAKRLKAEGKPFYFKGTLLNSSQAPADIGKAVESAPIYSRAPEPIRQAYQQMAKTPELQPFFRPPKTPASGLVKTGSTFRAKTTGYAPTAKSSGDNEMEGGIIDRENTPIRTLDEFRAGLAPFVTVAMDNSAFPYGTLLVSDSYPGVIFSVRDTGKAFKSKGKGGVDIPRINVDLTTDPSVNRDGVLFEVVTDPAGELIKANLQADARGNLTDNL